MDNTLAIGTELFLALDKIGASSLTDDDCCQLLAWLHYERGASEAPVHQFALHRDIRVAQQRLNIFGGEIPNGALVVKMQEYCHELEQEGNKPDWYKAILQKYKLLES